HSYASGLKAANACPMSAGTANKGGRNMLTRSRFIATMAAATALALTSAAPAFAQANFYEGKQIRLIVGSSSGSSYEFYARLVGRFLTKHIAGNPVVTLQI